MPVYFSCPNGHTLAALPEWAGRKVKCPLCQQIVLAPAAEEPVVPTAVPVPASSVQEGMPYGIAGEQQPLLEAIIIPGPPIVRDEDYDDYAGIDPRFIKKPNRKKRERLRLVNVGLAVHYAKYICFIAGILLWITGLVLVHVAAGFAFLSVLGYLRGWLAAPILGIIGSALGIFVPVKSGARPLTIAALCLESASLLFGLIGVVGVLGGAVFLSFGEAAVSFVFLVLAFLCHFAGFILSMLFLRTLARYLHEDGLADEALSVMIYYLVVVFAGLIIIILAAALFIHLAGRIGVVFVFLIETGWLVILIQVLFRILELLRALRTRLAAY